MLLFSRHNNFEDKKLYSHKYKIASSFICQGWRWNISEHAEFFNGVKKNSQYKNKRILKKPEKKETEKFRQISFQLACR